MSITPIIYQTLLCNNWYKTLCSRCNLTAQDNEKLLQQLKTGFKITINWNKYWPYPTPQTRNQYLNHLTDPSFQGVNRLFVLSFEDDAYQRSSKWYFLQTIEIKDYIVLTDGKKCFNQPVKMI